MVPQKVKNCIITLINPTAKIVEKSKNKKLCCKPSYQKKCVIKKPCKKCNKKMVNKSESFKIN